MNDLTREMLTEKIKLANESYAKGMPFLTDTEYDKLWQQLHTLEPNHPWLLFTDRSSGYGMEIHHEQQLFSLKKAFTIADLRLFLTRFDQKNLRIEPKYDGCSVTLYQSPSTRRLVTLGDGITGFDITRFIPLINWGPIPMVRQMTGELVILNKDWDPSMGANPRNVVAGWINSKDRMPPGIVTFIPHDYHSLGSDFPWESSDLETVLLRAYSTWKDLYPMDGLVIKVVDPLLRISASHNGTQYNWAVAWKPPIQTARTTVVDIHWNLSRQNRLVPTIEYETVELCGTLNSLVTGNNAKWIKDRNIRPSTDILIGKAGEIIPKVLEVYNNENDQWLCFIPSTCPCCEGDLTWDGPHLVCPNKDCSSLLGKRLAYFYGQNGIMLKGLGEELLSKLARNSEARTILEHHPYALLSPRIFNLQSIMTILWGQAATDTYLREVKEASGKYTQAHFIAALGYPQLGYKNALRMLQIIKYGRGTKHLNSKVITSFALAYKTYMDALPFLKEFIINEIQPPGSVQYCITGELSEDRSTIIATLNKFGWEFIPHISKSLHFLIVGNMKNKTRKLQLAEEQNVRRINETELHMILKQEGTRNE